MSRRILVLAFALLAVVAPAAAPGVTTGGETGWRVTSTVR